MPSFPPERRNGSSTGLLPKARLLLSLTVTVTVALTTLAVPHGAQAATTTVQAVTPELTDLAQRYLQDRASRLTGEASSGQSLTSVKTAGSLTAKLTTEVSAIDARRELLREANGGHKQAEVTVTDARVVPLHDKAVALEATEHTKLHFARTYPNAPTFEEYSLRHRFVFERQGKQWVLQDAAPEIAEGETAPDTQPLMTAGKPGSPAVSPDQPTAATTRPDTASATPAPSKADKGSSATAGYNYTAMLNYANRYWKSYNSNYRTYGGVGGDCTNFISQIVTAGGWTKVGSWPDSRSNNANWFYGDYTWTTSYTWPAAHNWYFFAAVHSRRTSTLNNVWKMLTTDIMQVDFDRNNNISHSIFVTDRAGSGEYANELYLTYHSNNTHNKPLSSFLASNPGAWYYAHRT